MARETFFTMFAEFLGSAPGETQRIATKTILLAQPAAFAGQAA